MKINLSIQRKIPHPADGIKKITIRVGLLASLCVLCASSALASFNATNGPYWPGETDYYYGNTEITTSGTLNNSGAMTFSSSTMPADTGPLAFWSGDYYWGVGVLDWGADGATINNNPGGTMQSIVSGTGEAQGCGIVTLQAVTINNSGLIDGEVQNNDGVAFGVNQRSSGLTVTNNAGATISATSAYSATAINCANNVSIVNNGTITCTGYAGTEGATSNRAYAYTINTGGGSPIFFENNGTLKAICPSTTATNNAQVFTCWNNNTNTFINTGLIYSENDSPIGYSFDLYYGVQGYCESFFNSGMITNYSVGGEGYAVLWMENDADNGNYSIYNAGTMACNSNAMDVLFAGGFGPAGNNHICYTNTGTMTGGSLILAFPATAWEAGQILTTGYGLSDGSQMHVTGLPTINPTINGGGSSSTLDFNLVGTLQKINGSAASGTNFSGLGGSGNITVSGKTYSWNNFSNGVFGRVSPVGNLPPPWQQQDIGSVGVAGGAVYAGGLLTLLGSGSDIGSTGDKFHYVYQSMSNNCTLIAFVSSPQSTQALAKAGLMIRDSLNANAANAFIGVTPGNGVTWQVRSSDGGSTTNSSTTGLSVWCQSYWVKLAQNGATLSGYYSVDGLNWTQLGSTTIASMESANFGGLAFCNHDNSSFGTATFGGISCVGGLLAPSVPTGLTATAGMEQATLNWQAASNAVGYNIGRSTVSGGPYTTVASVTATNYTDLNLAGRTAYYYVVTAVTAGCQGTNSAQVSATPTANVPPPWTAQDIGIVAVAGSESCTNNVFTVTASGSDYDASYTYTVNPFDDFRFVYEPNNSGNCTILARVTSLHGGNGWSKAGVTIRDSLNADAANVFIGLTPTNGVVFEHRSSDGVPGNWDNNVTNPVVPCWLKLVQSGSTFTGYYSTNGANWTQLGTTTVTIGGAEYVGMAVCANNNGTGYYNNPVTTTFTATFDNVTAPNWPPPTTPTSLNAVAVYWNQVSLTWNGLAGATGYNIKRSTNSGGPYTLIASGITATNFTDFVASVRAGYYYVVSAIVVGSETADSAEAALSFAKLTGAIIGTPGSWNNSGNTISNVFDNNLNTYFDAPDPGNGDWVGLDFGVGVTNVVTQINYCPRSGAESRMVGGVFQGANNTNFTGAVTLFTLTNQPAMGVLTSVSITNTTAFRYVRYLSPNGGYGNVAELEFYGYLAGASVLPPAPGGFAATAVSSSQINLTWNTVANASSYNVKRSTTNGGPYVIIATGVTATNYQDTSLAAGTAYFYVVSGVNTGGESTNSMPASATPQAPPTLNISQAGTNFMFSWPVTSAGFTLESSTNLASGSWVNVTSPAPQMVGDQWQIALPPSANAGAVFYRLAK